MKRTLHFLSLLSLIAVIIVSLTACQSEKQPSDRVLSFTDTSGLAEFQAWKTQYELQEPANITDRAAK